MTEQAAEAAADIFISYARDDADFAARLREGIHGGGFSVWMDTASMAGGERWTKEIESAIEGATSVVVVVSAASNESVWVRREVLYAQQLDKRVVPVVAEQVQLPVHLINLNAVPLHGDFEAGVKRLLNSQRGQSAGAPTATGKTTPPIRMGKALWLFAGAAVVLMLAVVAAQGDTAAAQVLTTGLAIGGLLLGVAWKADDAISLEFKRDLSLWLDGVDPAAVVGPMQRWPEHFAALFDRVFGKKHLSWRCFFRSSIASIAVFLLCMFIFMHVAPGEWVAYMDHVSPESDKHGSFISEGLREKALEGWSLIPPKLRNVIIFISLSFLVIISNLLPDYISLLETRWVVHRMQRTSSVSVQFRWLLLDFFATGAIFLLLYSIINITLVSIVHDSWANFVERVLKGLDDYVLWGLLVPHQDPARRFNAIPLWTTYFTTIWVWLYFIAQFLVRLGTPLRTTLGFLKYALPIAQRPFRAVGLVMALVACLTYCLVMLAASTFGGRASVEYIEPVMVPVESGEFQMGCVSGKECDKSQHPVQKVKPFAIGRYEVTFEEYDLFAKATGRPRPNAEGWGRGRRPVINVTWDDAVAYTDWLSQQTDRSYRLPSELEWEYAMRAGTITSWFWGDEESLACRYANVYDAANQKDLKERYPRKTTEPFPCEDSYAVTAPVDADEFELNPWKLSQMLGNVWEWTADCWHENDEGAPTDGGDCRWRVVRGGSWFHGPGDFRSAEHAWFTHDDRYSFLGLRLAHDLDK